MSHHVLNQPRPSTPTNDPPNAQTPDKPTLPTTDSLPRPIEMTQHSTPLLMPDNESTRREVPNPSIVYELTKDPILLKRPNSKRKLVCK